MRRIQFSEIPDKDNNLLIVPFCEGEPLSPFVRSLDKRLQEAININIKAEGFNGQKRRLLHVTTNGLHPIPKILFVGLGKRQDLAHDVLIEAGGYIATQAARIENASGIALDTTHLEKEDGEVKIPFGILLKEWKFNKYKRSDSRLSKMPALCCLCNAPSKVKEKFKFYESLLEGIFTARDLASEPANRVYPEIFAEECKKLQKIGIGVEVFDENQLDEIGAHAILAVGSGSFRPPRLVALRWQGANHDIPPVALVGKGVCFDSGGINIKTTGEIGDMKGDKSGSAVVTGTLQTLALLKAPVNVVGILGLVENMPDGRSMKPGDIISSLSGKTIEVSDTDNEGRLVLADCLWYAEEKYSPKAIVDLATLTLETMGALAGEYAGLFSENEPLVASLMNAGRKSGDKLWRLPMGEAFAKQIESNIADVKNIGQLGFGESSATAEFLKYFVPPGKAWAHIDIAGVFQTKEETLLCNPGATGFGVQLLVEWILNSQVDQ